MDGSPRLCAVTGAHGYVGSRLAAGLAARGHAVRGLTRSPTGPGEVGFSLEEGPAPGALEGVDALVHAAWDFGPRTRAEIEQVNVAGSARLLEEAARAGVARVVVVSTLSAFPGARSLYGRAKLAVEQRARELGGAAVRPGLVWGPQPGALYGSLRALALRLPVLPVFAARRLHLAHEDDLCELVARLVAAEGPAPGRPVIAAAREPLSLGEILVRATAASGRSVRIVPLPWRAAWAALRLLELAGARPRFRSDSVVSLVSLDEDPFAEGLVLEGVSFRPFTPS